MIGDPHPVFPKKRSKSEGHRSNCGWKGVANLLQSYKSVALHNGSSNWVSCEVVKTALG
ncbi:hypothetical protein KL928_005311, partial [Ogataea angusta]